MILDSGGDDIQHQGPPAQAEGGDQEDVQGEEVLDQGQRGPVQLVNIDNAGVSITDYYDHCKSDGVCYGP